MNVREKLDKLLADHRLAVSQFRSEQVAMFAADDALTNTQAAQAIIQTVAKEVQQQAHQKISSVVSRCLAAVFDDPYEFQILFEQKRGRTEAVLCFVRNKMLLNDPINEAGGGPVDVAAFALRLACLVLERPIRRRVMVLDEPFAKIRGIANRKRMRGLLESLADDFGVQFVLNIDAVVYPEFLLGTVVEL